MLLLLLQATESEGKEVQLEDEWRGIGAISIAISILFPSTWQWISIIDCNIERHVLPITAAAAPEFSIHQIRIFFSVEILRLSNTPSFYSQIIPQYLF